MTNWERIKRLAGPNPQWPNHQAYCFCNLVRAKPTTEWLQQFSQEAASQGLEATTFGGHLYVLVPNESP